MSNGANGADPLKDIRDAVNDATRNARNGYLFFVLAGLYVAIIVGSTTDEMLLRESPIKLPVFEVGIPIVGAYAVIPVLFLLLHLNLLVQFNLLGDKARQFVREMRDQRLIRSERARLVGQQVELDQHVEVQQ